MTRETLPSFVSHDLNQVPPVMPARVHNFGVDGFNALMEVKYLQKDADRRARPSPRIIVVL